MGDQTQNIIDVLSGEESLKTELGITIETKSIIVLGLGVIITGTILYYIIKNMK